ncbi:MAG: hypothetical protein K2O42_10485 [Oscillospiraceae bacterium]|nr:hypothetical protein [Oscillospiraceae bacterium]
MTKESLIKFALDKAEGKVRHVGHKISMFGYDEKYIEELNLAVAELKEMQTIAKALSNPEEADKILNGTMFEK